MSKTWECLLNTIDIMEDVEDISTISQGTSYPYTIESTPATCDIIIIDEAGYYTPSNPQNFFVDQSLNQDGVKCPVEIKIDSESVFIGEVLDISQNGGEGEPDGITITCIDKSLDLREEKITDFGLDKEWKMIEDTQEGSTHGVYPITCGVSPLSDDSIEISKALNSLVNIVGDVKNVGLLSSDNVKVEDDRFISEGAPIDVVAGGAYPQASAKSPYRYKTIAYLVAKITASISNKLLQIPPQEIASHYEKLGRPGYESILGNIGSSNPLNWVGYVTDILIDGTRVFFAYSVNRGSSYNSYILELNLSTADYAVKATLTATREVWGLAKIGDNLIILCTDSTNVAGTDTPTAGSYDSSASASLRKVQLIYLDVTQNTPSIGVLVPKTSSFPAQLACFYNFGTKIEYTRRAFEQDAKPDTRRRLIVHGTSLIYPYAKTDGATTEAGAAQVSVGATPTKITSFLSDGLNQAGFAYYQTGTTLYFATTFLNASNSTLKVVRETVS